MCRIPAALHGQGPLTDEGSVDVLRPRPQAVPALRQPERYLRPRPRKLRWQFVVVHLVQPTAHRRERNQALNHCEGNLDGLVMTDSRRTTVNLQLYSCTAVPSEFVDSSTHQHFVGPASVMLKCSEKGSEDLYEIIILSGCGFHTAYSMD